MICPPSLGSGPPTVPKTAPATRSWPPDLIRARSAPVLGVRARYRQSPPSCGRPLKFVPPFKPRPSNAAPSASRADNFAFNCVDSAGNLYVFSTMSSVDA